jgi:S-DNA-T family DNA segregation ATPase FtsK/SpoIIIE
VSRASGPGVELDVPDMLVVLDGSRRLRALPGVAQLLQDGPRLGIRLICLDADPRLLPEECRAVATFDDRGQVTLRQTGLDPVAGIRPDLVEVAWCERVARALAPIRDVSRNGDAALPEACRLLDLLNLEPPTGARIAAGWRGGGRTTRAVVGVGLDGPFTIDLIAHGPHGLVAGTTGAGKSELLQTLIASLAVGNRPDEMTFILVDYKGGSAFGECAALPHTVGMVTDLDPALVTRALESLGAELHRRERLLALAGVPGLPEYQAARSRNPTLAPLPRLLIVIDEFASLARELPDFVAGLVNVAQRGRSLGIHLILATQRPSGVVSAEIRANTNLRIALRVTDASESSDVIDAPDAAWISGSTPGRACARLGHNSLLAFQAGRVGGRRPGAEPAGASRETFVVPIGRESLGLPAPARPARSGGSSDDPLTDLAVLVDAIREAATALEIPRQPSPWLPALPETLLADELNHSAATAERADALRAAAFALVDLPTQQRREVWAIDLATFGHLFVAGAPRTGRSQVLRTIAGSLARENSSADVHLYGLDAGNGALLALTALPHCGAVVRSSETERSIRLLDKLTGELHRRLALLGEGQFSDISEQRAVASNQERLPHLVVLIDRWEAVLSSLGEQDHGAHVETVLQLAREGVGAGIHLIISGDQALLGGRMSPLTEAKLVLRLADKSDFSAIGIPARSVPDHLPPGRGFRAGGGRQVQVALLDVNPSGAAQTAALERIAAQARERDAEVPTTGRPFGVDVLPTRIRFDAAWQLRPDTAGPLWCAVGVGGDRLAAHGPDLATGIPAFVIAGPPESGRSTALRAAAASYLAVGTRLLLVTPRSSPLRELAGTDGVAAVLTGSDLDPALVKEALLDGGPLVLVIDDAELLRDCSAGPTLAAILRRELGERVGIVLAGDPDAICSGFSGWQVEARKARRGLLLSPQNLIEGELIGVHVPRAMIGRPVEPGRGLLHLGNGRPLAVQVPLP